MILLGVAVELSRAPRLITNAMGIRGLASALKQFASREQLRGRVVIDGPALAYYILRVARLDVSTILDEPTYALLGETATQWLDSLQSCGLDVCVAATSRPLPPYQNADYLSTVPRSILMAPCHRAKR